MLKRLFYAALALCLSTMPAMSGTISVFATGLMPTSDITDGSEVWAWSGTLSDQIADVSASTTNGHFEFTPSDLAAQSFSIGGTSIAFLTPTESLLDSRISLSANTLSVSLFFDPTDGFFTETFSNAGFSFSLSGQTFATDPNDLGTLLPLTQSAASTVLFLRPEGGSFFSATGSGAFTATPDAQVVPLPASATFLMLGVVGLFGVTRMRARR